MKPYFLKFDFSQEKMEILIEAMRAYSANPYNDPQAREEAADMLQAYEAQYKWATAK